MKINPLHLIDFYKADHRRQYPEGTSLVFSNFTPRKSRIPGVNHVVFFGLQYYVKEYLIKQWNENFFNKPLNEVLHYFNRRKDMALGPNSIGDDHITSLHKLGYLPLKIIAVPEGEEVLCKVPCLLMWNTKPEFYWLVNYLETSMSASLWQMCTSATIAKEYKKLLRKWAKKTGGDPAFVDWQGHDFSFRGMSSIESAAMSGAGHLTSFTGTDTVHAIDFLEEYYNADCTQELIGGSVPATEHSVMCMGQKDGEFETFKRLITETYPKGIVSVVSDTWDLWAVLTDYLPRLKDVILARDGKVVIRPDSGDPVDIICGIDEPNGWEHPNYIPKESGKEVAYLDGYAMFNGSEWVRGPRQKGVIELLWDTFGGTINENGYKQLDPHIGAIYGDSITLDRANSICERLEQKGFASTNVVLGIGSYTYQYNTRDTQGWAMKATYGEIETWHYGLAENPNGTKYVEKREIFKDPITDDGTKKSARGLIAVNWDMVKEAWVMEDQVSWLAVDHCDMDVIFENGKLITEHSLAGIRATINSSIR